MHLHKYLNINLNTDALLFNRGLTVKYANQKVAFISEFECVKNALVYYSVVTTSKYLFAQILI